jgi:hypothetical protein
MEELIALKEAKARLSEAAERAAKREESNGDLLTNILTIMVYPFCQALLGFCWTVGACWALQYMGIL